MPLLVRWIQRLQLQLWEPDSSPDGESHRLGPVLANLGAWAWIMVLNAIWIGIALPAPHSVRNALSHHGHDAAEVAALAALTTLVHVCGALLRRRLRAPNWVRYPALFLLGWWLARATFADVHGFIERQMPSPGAGYWFPLLTLLGGVSLAGALGIGTLLNRRYLRGLALLGCSAVVLLNQSVLVYEYAGPHLFATVSSAVLLGTAFSALPVSAVVRKRLVGLGRWAIPLAVLSGIFVLTATPRPPVAMRLFQTPGAVLAPFVVQARLKERIKNASTLDPKYAHWLEPRVGRPEVPPGVPLLPREDLMVVLLTVDSFRADLIGDSRYTADLPEIEAMRRAAVSFTHARSIAAATMPSISSMFAGVYPLQLHEYRKKVGRGQLRSYKDTPYLALPDTAIETVHVYEHGGVGNAYALGFKQEVSVKKKLGAAVLKVLKSHEDGPLFLYAHFMAPHHPYAEPDATHRTDYQRYVKDVAAVDQQLRDIRSYLRKSGKYQRTVLILSADHGEAFGEHGLNHHSKTVYDEMIRIPLLIEAPGVAAREVATPVSAVDLAPTVRDLFGHKTPGALMGQSLVPWLRGGDVAFDRPMLAQTTGGMISALVFPDGHKVIYDRKRQLAELYDLSSDPGERNNLLEDPATSLHLGTLVRFIGVHRHDSKLAPKNR